jgi:nitrogen fixation protein FixH
MKMTTRSRNAAAREFTGRHMLLIMLAFFGVIITVNLTMATFASTTWSGFVVKNSYVASQQFNEKAEWGRAQAALEWTGTLAVDNSAVRYRLTDKAGEPIAASSVVVTFQRAVSDAEDRTFVLEPGSEGWRAAVDALHDGAWIVEIKAEAGLEQPYRDVRRIILRNGELR